MQFPVCEVNKAISICCLNLYYSVKFKAKDALQHEKEKKDRVDSIVLNSPPGGYSEPESDDGQLSLLTH